VLAESKFVQSKCPLNTWRICDFSSFEVRIDNGLFKKEKRPSARPLYNPLCVYGFRSVTSLDRCHSLSLSHLMACRVDHQIPHIASVMPTPTDLLHIEEIAHKGIFVPPVLILQIHIPSPHNVMHLKRDGPGICFVMYFTLSKVRCLKPVFQATDCLTLTGSTEGIG
jgi:hypothetical protein